jgi:phosphatidate cytidylyltransferase
MFKVRLISGIILLVLAILLGMLGGNWLFAATLIISLIGMWELYKTINIHKTAPGIIGYLAGIAYYALLFFDLKQHFMALFIVYLLILMAMYAILFPRYKTEQVIMAFFGLFYVSVMLSYIYQVRVTEDGIILIWLIFIGAWGSDTFAYCAGMLFGKHKMVPKLSPKKSWEGSIGGILGAALLGFIYAVIFKNKITGISNPQLIFAIIGAASSIISQIGDLAASAIKRDHDIKDYGKLIPGHGGILDRFDSIIFTAPIVYYLAEIFRYKIY